MDKQERIKEYLKKDIKALVVLGLIVFLSIYLRDIATTVSLFLLLILIWDKYTEVWAAQTLMYVELQEIKAILQRRK